jgi:hypothetical protein
MPTHRIPSNASQIVHANIFCLCILLTALSLHLHEQPLLAGSLGFHVLIGHEVIECRKAKADPTEVFHEGLGIGRAIDGYDKAVASEVRYFAEFEEGHEAADG